MRISIHGLVKSFPGAHDGARTVLDGIEFDEEVSTLALIGPSGGGKSTLLRILGGLSTPDAGTVALDGAELPGDERALVDWRARLGYVFQQNGLFAHLTALENITLPLVQVHHLSADEAEARGRALLERLGLSEEAGKRPAELSGGQQQRVAIARAVAPRPALLLLDEPTSALDPEYTTEVLDVIRDLAEEGARFIIVTHEMGFARRACEKVAFLYEGCLHEVGPSEELFAHPATPELRRFLGKLTEWSL